MSTIQKASSERVGLRSAGYSRIDVRATPADQRYARYHAARAKEGLPTWVCACLTINCCMGSGFLALPRIFSLAGLVLSSVVMVVMCGAMQLTTSWETEAMVRAEAVVVRQLERAAPTRLVVGPRSAISNRSFEVTELCSIFGGARLHGLYSAIFLCYLLSTSWAYAFVFAESLSTAVPLFGYDLCAPDDACPLYRAYAVVFLCLAVPLSLLEPNEQATFQIMMTCFRFVVALVMTLTALVEAKSPGLLFRDVGGDDVGLEFLGKPRGLGILLPAAIFALNINGNVPLIAKSMRDRENVDIAICFGLWIPCVMYIFIGTSVAVAFGDAVPRSANIVWENFAMSGDGLVAQTLRFFATVVVLFPAADVLSVFPLNTTVVANNLIAIVYGAKVDKFQHNTTLRRVSRLVVAVPPIIGACLWSNFTRIIDYTGVLAIFISCVFPPALSILGRRLCMNEFGDARLNVTRYSIDGDRTWPKLLIVAAGITTVVLALSLDDD
ncbi:hypothetical protein CTAYLR_006672 [Chrysophaeum taylorii]|uniref:Amino acid transporter transmembrane domain-containing protein n=1 Tax=Chrysophaeum taylorii TaxID=2483200 RepID=A0AAD7XLV6_9STRA|nr:hypothetical protein CTAYLR_006672 [Chrysophaeum taylorii]